MCVSNIQSPRPLSPPTVRISPDPPDHAIHAPNLVEQIEQLKAKIGQLDARVEQLDTHTSHLDARLDAIFKILIYERTTIERENTLEGIRVGMFDPDTCNRILEQYDRELESIDTMYRLAYKDMYGSI
jgi:hypothetical protein